MKLHFFARESSFAVPLKKILYGNYIEGDKMVRKINDLVVIGHLSFVICKVFCGVGWGMLTAVLTGGGASV
ncbi:hypothetical protein F7734_03725 [Scytonema sp. UIC 10036]|uniref:hypothetical protein n=1 Tax=Scytonema sp. UIC 10036 TaxID=2304196 RepID=UPI0012DAF2EA|nr:hypothetical protein [Scytonema sp. UIC 10036]MUG91640.1 hypothetical protein [Scytonema sp. UIC 10036]